MVKIGYIVPEFPGQTHIFFWREILRLEEMGIEVDIVSTRLPPLEIRSHTWSDRAEARTIYLQEANLISTVASILKACALSDPRRWLKCAKSISRASVSLSDRVKLITMSGFGAKLGRIAQLNRWDHIHVHSCANAANIATYASILSGIPYSLTLHGALGDYGSNQVEKWGNAKFGIAVTKTLLRQVEAELGFSVAQKTVVAPMGVNLSNFQRPQPYIPWTNSSAARIISVGRLNPGKGHDVLLNAISIIKARGTDVHLTIIGQDEMGGEGYYKTISRLVSDLKLTGNVTLAGAQSEDCIRDGLLSSHLFVSASLHEAIGVATMEAMAMGMPVIATRVGGVPELIDHERDGFLVEPGKADELAAAIESILYDPDLSKRFAFASREKIVRGFQDTISAKILSELLTG